MAEINRRLPAGVEPLSLGSKPPSQNTNEVGCSDELQPQEWSAAAEGGEGSGGGAAAQPAAGAAAAGGAAKEAAPAAAQPGAEQAKPAGHPIPQEKP